jgi:hypothetical protein
MVYFQTKNSNLGNFLGPRLENIEIYDHLVHFLFIGYSFSGFGIMHQEKSGNPDVGTYVCT